MLRNMLGTGAGIVLIVMAGAAVGQQALGGERGIVPPPVQIIQPEIEVLERPIVLEVQVDPSLGMDTSMRILCATNMYRGEVSMSRGDSSVRLSIAGEIKDLGPAKIFVSFDVEAQSEDMNGGRGFAGSGAAILAPGKPKNVLTIGGSSVILFVRLAPEESG